MARFFLVSASSLSFLSVALGAFGAHALKNRLTEAQLAIFKTGVEYQFLHALALLGLGIYASAHPSPALKTVGILFLVGIFVFSGSLYILALSDVRGWGAVTPIGGICFLSGWALLTIHFIKQYS